MHELIVPSALLFTIAALGGTDIVLYHMASHGIRSHPDSKIELVFHGLRGPTYAFLFGCVPNFAFHGAFFWLLAAVLLFDVAISVADFWVESASRQFLGGLPSGEYVLHMIIAMFFGAFVFSIALLAPDWARRETALVFKPFSQLVSVVFGAMAMLVLWSGIQDACAAYRMWRQPARRERTPDA